MEQVLIKPKDTIKVLANVKLYVFSKEIDNYWKAWWLIHPWGHAFPLQNESHAMQYCKDAGENRVVDVGIQQIIALMIATNTNSFTHCQNGSGTNAVTAGDIDLQTPISPRIAITNRYPSGLAMKADTFFATGDENGSWEETALFTAITAGIILCRKRYSSTFTKNTGNTALVAWTITFAPQ